MSWNCIVNHLHFVLNWMPHCRHNTHASAQCILHVLNFLASLVPSQPSSLISRLMSDYEVTLVNDNMQEFYVRFYGPSDSKDTRNDTDWGQILYTLIALVVFFERQQRTGRKPRLGEYSQSCWTAFLFVNTHTVHTVSLTLNLHSSFCWRNLEGACWASWSVSLQVALDWVHEQDLPPKYRRAVSVVLCACLQMSTLSLHWGTRGMCAFISDPALCMLCVYGLFKVQENFYFFYFSWDTKEGHTTTHSTSLHHPIRAP